MISARSFLGLVSVVYLILFVAATAMPGPNAVVEAEATRVLHAADRLYAEGRTEEALSAYEEILKKYPATTRKSDIMVKIARSYTRIGDDDLAIQTYLKLISKNPDSIQASQAVSLMINLYARRYRFEEVIVMSKHLAQQFPGTQTAAMALYRSAGYLYSQQRFQEAIKEYENFIEKFPESIMRTTALNRLVSIYIKQGMFKEAEQRLMDRLEKNPEDTYMLRQLALVYQKQGEYDRALALYHRMLAVDPDDVDMYEQLGELYAERGDKEKAIAEWFKITKSAPGQYSRHQMLAQILKSHGFYDEAAAEYRKAIELQPTISYLYTQLADLYVVKKQFDSAMDVYLDAMMRFPINLPSRSMITTSMLELCDQEKLYDQVISRLKTHLSSSPDNISALLTLSDVYFHQDKFDSSLQQLKTIASFHPDKGDILFGRAQTLERERELDHAIKFYQTVLDLFPESEISSYALMYKGQLESQLHQTQAAVISLQRLISQSSRRIKEDSAPFLIPAYILMGDIHLQQTHNVQEALYTYKEAKRKIESQPINNREFYKHIPDLDLRIAECYRLMGEYDSAEKVLDSIPTRFHSRSVAAQIAKLRADCYFSRGDFVKSTAQYQEATQQIMNEDWVNDSLERIALIKEYSDEGLQPLLQVHSQTERLRKLGQYDEALTICISAIKEYATGDRIQLEIGDLLALQMKAADAISAYKELIQSQSPLAPEAQFRIARIYWQQLGNVKQAMEGYSQLIENYPDSILVADARKQIRRLASEETLDTNIP